MKMSAEQHKELHEALDALAIAIGTPKAAEALMFITGTVPTLMRHARSSVALTHDPDLQAEARKVVMSWLQSRAVVPTE